MDYNKLQFWIVILDERTFSITKHMTGPMHPSEAEELVGIYKMERTVTI